MKLNIEILLICVGIGLIYAQDDSSDVANTDQDDQNDQTPDEIFRNLVRPFRMEKLNLIWVKAQQVNNCKVHIVAVTLFLNCKFYGV